MKKKQTKFEKQIQNSPVWQAILETEKKHGIVEPEEFYLDDLEDKDHA